MRFIAMLLAAGGTILGPSQLWHTNWPRKPFGPKCGLTREEWSFGGKPFARSTTWFDGHGTKLCMVFESLQAKEKPQVLLISGKSEVRIDQFGELSRTRLESPFDSGGRLVPDGMRLQRQDGETGQPPAPIGSMTILGRKAEGFEWRHIRRVRDWFWQEIPLREEVWSNSHLSLVFQATYMDVNDPPEPRECVDAGKFLLGG